MPEIKTVDVGEVSLEYILTGPADRPAIAFVHGLGGNLSMFFNQEENFSKSFRVLLLSLRGHGGSSCPMPETRESFTLDVMAKDVVSLLDRLNLPAVHWVGNSMGGLVGYQMLKDAPERLLSLATFGIAAELHYGPVAINLLTLFKDIMIKIKGYEGFCRMAGPISSKLPETQEKVVEMAMATPPAVIKYGHMNVASVNYLQVLAEANIPLLLIKCEHDRAINKALKSTLSVLEQSENAEVVEMTGVGHYPNLDRPDDFNSILEGWYTRPLCSSRNNELPINKDNKSWMLEG